MGDTRRVNIARLMGRLFMILILLLAGGLLMAGITGQFVIPAPGSSVPETSAPGTGPERLPPGQVREHFLSRGVEETGAINLVSAIYLGYRAFDTFGETIVLLLAVSGVIFLIEAGKESKNG